jgi:hypothetical protein
MPQIACPNCGASVESTERACSYCGAALPASVSSSAPTVRASREELDAMLKGTPPPTLDATLVSSEPLKKFGSSAEAMDAVQAESHPDAPTTFAPVVGEVVGAPKKSGIPVWVWGCAAAFVLFCCLCLVLPAALYLLTQNM